MAVFIFLIKNNKLDTAIEVANTRSDERKKNAMFGYIFMAFMKQGNLDKAIEVADMMTHIETRAWAYHRIDKVLKVESQHGTKRKQSRYLNKVLLSLRHHSAIAGDDAVLVLVFAFVFFNFRDATSS